jgi:hypothetical protein
MNIVREYFPNGMPMMIQGVLSSSNIVEPTSIRMHPITDGGKVLPALPICLNEQLVVSTAIRLTDLYAENNTQDK